MNYISCTFVALGGALGALSRYFVSTLVNSKYTSLIPWGTITVNMLGCFFLGLVFTLSSKTLLISPNAKSFLAVGFLGAFTTFSTFSVETLSLLKGGNIGLALLNGGGSILLGLLAAWLGTLSAKLFI
ncbi:MAG: fluoride efflux transporter CrcB [Clostridia bacterium]|nr:fluoride efflux transporter CrcB [Clostridia bacterium]MDD4048470.1 fluoride efflux transporter CrcB [Clostridia bacterium]